jgi:hypothetical protein
MSTSSALLPAPQANRLRRPGWRDPRLLVGVALIAVSVLAGSWLVRASARTVGVYAASRALVPGSEVDGAALTVVQVRGVDAAAYLPADRPLPSGAVVLRVVGRGELVPGSAVGDAARLSVRAVSVPLRVAPPTDLTVGSLVDLWYTPAPGSGEGPPKALVSSADVAGVSSGASRLEVGAGTVQVLVGRDDLPEVLAALAGDGVVDVVPVPGSAG